MIVGSPARSRHVGHFSSVRGALAALALAVAFLFAAPAQAQNKIAVVDVQRAVMQTEDGLRAQATLKKLFDSRQQELNKKQADLGKQKEDIDKQAKVMSQTALQKRVEEWQKAMMELQTVFLEYNKELEKKQKEITDPIVEKIIAIVKRLATTDGFDMVIERQFAHYYRADLDLTDRAIQLYNTGGAAPKK